MSTVVVQVGQCGNQMGLEWWKLLSKYPVHSDTERSPFSCIDGTLPAVFVDSEAKVIWGAQQFVRNRRLLDSNIVLARGGRGNNWAYGYNGPGGYNNNSLLLQTMEAVRRTVEKADYFGGVLLLHSLSGGTGSGLGSKLCEEIREIFPTGHILTVSVAPHQTGESPLQGYNCLLSLAALNRSADGILLFCNDKALTHTQAVQRMQMGTSQCTMPAAGSLSAMNTYIASCIAGLLLPVHSLTTGRLWFCLCVLSGLSLGMEPWELIRSVCPSPTAKLLYTTQACSRENKDWDFLASSTLQTVPQRSSTGKFYTSRAVLAVARGNKDSSFLNSNAIEKLTKGHHCVSWNPFPVDHWTDPLNKLGDSISSRLLTVCSNHSSVSSLLDHVIKRSKEMLQARAYLHWYKRYGIEEMDFTHSLESCSAVLQEYDMQ